MVVRRLFLVVEVEILEEVHDLRLFYAEWKYVPRTRDESWLDKEHTRLTTGYLYFKQGHRYPCVIRPGISPCNLRLVAVAVLSAAISGDPFAWRWRTAFSPSIVMLAPLLPFRLFAYIECRRRAQYSTVNDEINVLTKVVSVSHSSLIHNTVLIHAFRGSFLLRIF